MKQIITLIITLCVGVTAWGQWNMTNDPLLYRQSNSTSTIIRTTRTDNTQEGLFQTDGWGNFNFNRNLKLGGGLLFESNGSRTILKTFRTDGSSIGKISTNGIGSFAFSNDIMVNQNVYVGQGQTMGQLILRSGNYQREVSLFAYNSYIANEKTWGLKITPNQIIDLRGHYITDATKTFTILSASRSDGTSYNDLLQHRVYNGTNNHDINFINNGNVGIGTRAPKSKLHIKDGNFLLEMNYSGSQDPKVMIDNENGGANINQTYYRWSGVDARYYATRFHNEGQNGFSIQIGGVSKNIGDHSFINVFNITNNGNIGIGTITPDYKLDVAGTIRATEIKVEAQTADFVFSDTYNLKDLTEVENYIKTHKHLPDIPSAEEMEASGVDLAEMNKLLLQKVEELTLYAIQQKEERKKEQGERKNLKEELDAQKQLVKQQEERLVKLEMLLLGEATNH